MKKKKNKDKKSERCVKSIDIRQRGVKRLQQRLAAHRDELNVHADHLTDLRLEVNKVEVAARQAAASLDRAIESLGRGGRGDD